MNDHIFGPDPYPDGPLGSQPNYRCCNRFEFVINLQTTQALSIEVPPGVLSIAEKVIE